jgi:PhnB protein
MHIEPYLFFNGRCDEAIAFYKQALRAEVLMLMRNKEAPEKPPPGMVPPGSDDKVMHATLRIGTSNLMCSDGRCDGKPVFNGFSLSLDAANEAEAERLFNALAAGGTVQMPLAKTFWSPKFGMLTDRFGVGWMVSVAGR